MMEGPYLPAGSAVIGVSYWAQAGVLTYLEPVARLKE